MFPNFLVFPSVSVSLAQRVFPTPYLPLKGRGWGKRRAGGGNEVTRPNQGNEGTPRTKIFSCRQSRLHPRDAYPYSADHDRP